MEKGNLKIGIVDTGLNKYDIKLHEFIKKKLKEFV